MGSTLSILMYAAAVHRLCSDRCDERYCASFRVTFQELPCRYLWTMSTSKTSDSEFTYVGWMLGHETRATDVASISEFHSCRAHRDTSAYFWQSDPINISRGPKGQNPLAIQNSHLDALQQHKKHAPRPLQHTSRSNNHK